MLRCEEILLRVIDVVDEMIPSVYDELFKPCESWASRQPLTAQGDQPVDVPPLYLADTCPTLRDLYMAGELEWSEGEPAINGENIDCSTEEAHSLDHPTYPLVPNPDQCTRPMASSGRTRTTWHSRYSSH